MTHNAVLLCLLVLPLAGGCAPAPARTEDPVTFLRLQLLQAPPGQSENGWFADYAGKKDGYHIMKVQWSNFMALPALWEGSFHEEMHRCPAASLPEGYPQDLARDLAAQTPRYWNDQLKPTTYFQFPRGDLADQAIREYLQKHGKLTPELKQKLTQESK
jgi:hypothetical protein